MSESPCEVDRGIYLMESARAVSVKLAAESSWLEEVKSARLRANLDGLDFTGPFID